jgi:hypothetical protein
LIIAKIFFVENEKWKRHSNFKIFESSIFSFVKSSIFSFFEFWIFAFFESLIFRRQYVMKHFVCFWTRFNNFVNLRRVLFLCENDLLYECTKTNEISSTELIIVARESQKKRNSSNCSKNKAFWNHKKSCTWSFFRVCHLNRYR